MPKVPFGSLGEIGVLRDIYTYDTPPEAWSAVQNCRMGSYGAEKFLGHAKTLGTGSAGWAVAPYWLFYLPVAGASDLWIGAGATKLYSRTGISPYTETNITRQSGGVDVNYTATESAKWNGSVFGGVAIMNNGADQPQYWIGSGKAKNLADSGAGADAWVSTTRAGVMKGFGRYLVGIDITTGGTRDSQRVKWSHPADPGALPVSWDYTNPAYDAGEYPLQDARGDLLDMLVLRNQNLIYSSGDVWSMAWVGGQDIFRFDQLFREQGALAGHCVALFKKQTEMHCVLGPDDIFVHNGQSAQSIISPAMRRWFFQQIDPNYFARSFVVTNPVYNEIWVCVPELGSEQPTLALVWNWETGAIGFRDLLKESSSDTRTTAATKGTPCIVTGLIEDVTSEPWSGDSDSWDSDTSLWDAHIANPATPRLLMAERSSGKRTFILDSTAQFDGYNFAWLAERQGLAIAGRDRTGKPRSDVDVVKLLTEVWPRIDAPIGTVVSLQVGSQMDAGAAVSWGVTYSYTVGSSEFVPVYEGGRFLSLRYSYTGSAAIRLVSHDLVIEPQGIF